MVVYTDGSFTPEREGHPAKAGWGVRCVDGKVDGNTDDQGTICAELCGPVTIDPRDPAFDAIFSLVLSNSELSIVVPVYTPIASHFSNRRVAKKSLHWLSAEDFPVSP